MKKFFLFVLLFLIGCSAHLERDGKTTDEFYKQINTNCTNENVIVTLNTNKIEEGVFIKLDNDILTIKKGEGIKELLTHDILNIKYERGFSLSGMGIGALTGLGTGLLILQMSGGNGSLVDGGDGTIIILAIPTFTTIGVVWGGFQIDKYNTIILNK